MESALIVSCTEKGTEFFTEALTADSCEQIASLSSCSEARRMLLERDFDLVIVNAPLKDESGESLSRHIASKGISQVILLVKSEYFDEISAATEQEGVLVIAKPINRQMFWTTLKLAKSVQSRLQRMQAESGKLKQKIEDIRIIDHAKCILIAHLSISEQQAHRFIEKQAMDMRATRRSVAEQIIKTYSD